MTDNEIVKALECCMGCDCKNCPYYDGDTDNEAALCKDSLIMDALKIVNSQKAEIERLSEDVDGYKAELESEHLSRMDNIHDLITEIKKSKVEAIKEFAERLSERAPHITEERFLILRDEIDNLVKEMTEEANNAE